MSFWSEVGDFVSDVAHGIGDVATDVWHGIEDGAEVVGDFMVDTLPLAATAVGTFAGGPVGGFIAGTGADYLQSMLDKKHAKDQLETEMAFNAEQAALNRQFQVDMWNANNQYNSTQAQLQRLMAAGINPNMMFGNGYNPVGASAPGGSQASSPGSIANGLLLQQAQISNLNASARKSNSDADLNEQEYAYNNVTFSERVKSLQYANDETKVRIGKIIADTNLQTQAFEFLARKNEQELENLRLLANRYRVEIDNLKKQGSLTDKQIDYVVEQTIGQNYANQLSKLELDFSKQSGVPHGTAIEEALWKTVVNGDFDSLIDTFITSVEDYAIKYLDKRSRSLVGDDVIDAIEDFIEDRERVNSGVSTHKNGRSEFDLPPYARSNHPGIPNYNR